MNAVWLVQSHPELFAREWLAKSEGPHSVFVVAEAFRAFPQRIFDSAVVKDAEVLRLRSGLAMRTRYFAQDGSVEKVGSS